MLFTNVYKIVDYLNTSNFLMFLKAKTKVVPSKVDVVIISPFDRSIFPIKNNDVDLILFLDLYDFSNVYSPHITVTHQPPILYIYRYIIHISLTTKF